MPIYKQITEITNIDDIWTGVDRDIVEIYFGDKNVFTVWQTYEGTLPATINANGDDMKQYQLYGAAGGVGDRTENSFDYVDCFDNINPSSQYFSFYILQVKPNTQYTLHTNFVEGTSRSGSGTTRETPFIVCNSSEPPTTAVGGLSNVSPQTITTDNDGVIRIYVRIDRGTVLIPCDIPTLSDFKNGKWLTVIEGSTAPVSCIPYGYKLDMGVKSGNRFDYRDYVDGYYISSSGVELEASRDPQYTSSWLNHSSYISVSPDENYTISAHHQNMNIQQTVAIAWYDENIIFILRDSTIIPKKEEGAYSFTATAPQNAKFAIFNFFADDVQKVMFTPGTTPPDEYQPYSNTVTPIYIGDTTLEKDEYVDYHTGKVFRRTENEFDYEKYFETCTPFNTYFDYVPMQLKPNTQYTVYTNCLSGTSGAQSQNRETSVIICPAEVVFNTANGGVYGSTPFTLTTQASGLCNIGIRTVHGINSSYSDIYGESNFADGSAYINVVEGAVVSETYIPYLQPTDPPVPLPALPTVDGETIVDYAGNGTTPEKALLKYRKENF